MVQMKVAGESFSRMRDKILRLERRESVCVRSVQSLYDDHGVILDMRYFVANFIGSTFFHMSNLFCER